MIGLGSHALTAMGFPGYNAIVPPSAKSVANYLEEAGYVNYAYGEKVDEDYFEMMHISTYSLAETFDVGRDSDNILLSWSIRLPK